MGGVSGQAVSAVESGLSDPSLRVALALAQALGMTVEELFGAEGAIEAVPARVVGGDPGPGRPAGARVTRVTLAPVGDSFVALPLAGPTVSRAGFLPAGGLLASERAPGGSGRSAGSAGSTPVRPIGPPRPTLVVSGCDPALPLLTEPLSLLDPPIGLSWWPCSSQEALRLAAEGLVHAAGAHLRDRTGEYNTGTAAELLSAGGEGIGFSAWREGLARGPAAGDAVAAGTDVVSRGLRLVDRGPGGEAPPVPRR